jgi:signal transduction histidine kinase
VRTRPRTFWAAYAAAWLPYAAVYAAIFAADFGATVSSMLLPAAYNIVPAALLGVGVIRLCDRFPWAGRGATVAAVHVVGAACYAALWWLAISLAMTLVQWLSTGAWESVFLIGPALRWQFFSGMMVYATIASAAYGFQVAESLRVERERAARAEAERARAELLALRARLDPHFLFNTLHSVMALVRYSPPEAEAALERFAGMMRYALRAESGDGDDDAVLGDEWEFVRSYVALERLRLGDRLVFEADVDPDALDCAVPVFTLQPLVENAVRHAVAPSVGGGRLRVRIALEGDAVAISVADDGPGAEPGSVEAAGGIGLRTVRRRLELRYGGLARFSVETAPGKGFRVDVRVPAEAEGARSSRARAGEAAWQSAH